KIAELFLAEYPSLFRDSARLSQHNPLGLHWRVWVIDWQSPQGYKVSIVMATCERWSLVEGKTAEPPASMGLSGHNGFIIRGLATPTCRKRTRSSRWSTWTVAHPRG